MTDLEIGKTIEDFSKIKWTDMALMTFRTERRRDIDDLVFEIVGLYSEVGNKFELHFEDATFVRMEIDFASKRSCADAFDGGNCYLNSPWKTSLIKSNPYDDFSSYLHFALGLVPKGGKIDLLARAFEFRQVK